jgi:hypothetical protein
MHGWSRLTIDQRRALLATPFGLTRSVRAGQSAFRHLRGGEIEGRTAWRFDLVLNLRYVGSRNETVADNYSAGIVSLHNPIEGRLGLERRGFLREPQSLGVPEVDAGTDELRRRFRVRCSSPELARAILDEQLCEWLAGRGRGFHYEIVHDRVLAYGWRRYVSTRGPLHAALTLAQLADGPTAVEHPDERHELSRQLEAIGLG